MINLYGKRHIFKAQTIEDHCEICNKPFVDQDHYGIGWTRPNENIKSQDQQRQK